MGDAAGEVTDRVHLLRLAQVLLHEPLLGDVRGVAVHGVQQRDGMERPRDGARLVRDLDHRRWPRVLEHVAGDLDQIGGEQHLDRCAEPTRELDRRGIRDLQPAIGGDPHHRRGRELGEHRQRLRALLALPADRAADPEAELGGGRADGHEVRRPELERAHRHRVIARTHDHRRRGRAERP